MAYSIIETKALSGTSQILVSTGGGIAAFDGHRFVEVPLPDSIKPDGLMLAEAHAPDGALELWVAASGGRAARFSKGVWQVYGVAHGLNTRSAEAVVAIDDDVNARVLILGDRGVFAFHEDAKRGPRFELLPGSPRRAYRAAELVRVDGARELWVGTLAGVVVRKTSAGWDTVDVASQQAGGRVTALQIVPGHAGGTAVYVGTYGGRLSRLGVGAAGTLEMRGTRRDFMRTVLPVPTADGRVELWMGTLNAGLLHLSASGQLTEYSRETGQVFTQSLSLGWLSGVKRSAYRSDTVAELRELWVGTDLGPFRREGSRFVEQTHGIGKRLVRTFVRGPLPDGTTSLLAGTDSGVFRWLGTEWEYVRGFGHGSVRAMSTVQGTAGPTLLVAFDTGTASATLSEIAFDRTRDALEMEAVVDSQVRAFQRSRLSAICGLGAQFSDRVFVGTQTNGLWWRSANTTWQPVPVELQRALGVKGIRALNCGSDGRLLVAVGTGLVVLDVHQANKAAWTVVSVAAQEDGLPATEVNAMAPAIVNGLMWIGTSRGVGALQLSRVAQSPVPTLSIALQSEGRSLDARAVMQLRANNSDLTIRTVLQTYHREDDTQYQVLLHRDGEQNTARDLLNAGIDDSSSWTDAPDARYRSLSAGQYMLRVRARDFAGRIVNLPVKHFEVVPPVWQTWWALLLYSLFVAGCVYITHRWRLHTLERTNARLATSERHMRASERKFRALFDQSTDAHLLIDGPHITSINAPGRLLLGLNAQAALDASTAPDLHDWRTVLPSAIAAELDALAADNAVHEYEVELANGIILPLSAQITAVPLDDRSLWHLVLRDLSTTREAEQARLRLEDQVRDAQKFESLGTLAGGVAHDFNNLLGVIRGNVELALDILDDRDAVAAHLGTVFDASERARDLVRQILTFSRRSSTRDEFVDVARLTRHLQPMLRSMIPTSIEIVVQVPNDPMLVLGDSTQLQQILLNLASNAEYSMRAQGGGHLHITLDGVHVPDTNNAPHGELIRLRVTDTGVGMTPAVLERVFEPFYTTKPTGEGTGLGMAVLHGIVASHGGRVAVSSEPGLGTTFEIFLPAATAGSIPDAKSVAAADAESTDNAWHIRTSPPNSANVHIVLVDDEPAVAQVSETALKRLGYTVTTFLDPMAALAFVASSPHAIDLVITDQTMPGLSGDVLATELRKLNADLPVIIMSGFSYVLTADRLATVGEPMVLQKPVSLATLRLAVDAALEGRVLANHG
ncbi:MAG: ATP-binding protein [Gemmatimonadaceae bacterium]